MNNNDGPDTIVLIHGLFMTPLSWEKWVARYTDRGYRVMAPAWPGMEGDIEEVRRKPMTIARLTIKMIVDSYDKIIRSLDRPPILMGHSFGGGFVQVLLDRGLGAAGVGIDPAAPKGVLRLPLSTLRSGFPVLGNPLNYGKAIPLTPKQFHYAFTNTLSEGESLAVYRRYHVPAASRVLFAAAFANLNPGSALRVDYNRPGRAPLLLIGGGADHLVPPAYSRDTFAKYKNSRSITAYKEFPGRSHYTCGQDGWEAVADYALDWVRTNVGVPAASRPVLTTA